MIESLGGGTNGNMIVSYLPILYSKLFRYISKNKALPLCRNIEHFVKKHSVRVHLYTEKSEAKRMHS